MKRSGLADSPFFLTSPSTNETTAIQKQPIQKLKPTTPERELIKVKQESSKRNIDNTRPTTQNQPEKQDSMHASMQASNNASMQALNQEGIIETIRKAVKDVGKDSATYRFTPEEKKALLEISFAYKMQGYKTSENELTRIAINFILEDQKQNGLNSVLQRVLDALSK